MTKFEEEVDKVAKQLGYESLSLLIGDCEEANKIYIHFENWHSDEQFQKLLEQNAELTQENNIVNQIDSQLAKENEDLKSQLQQQALPVVPECVGNFLSGKSIFKIANGDIPDDVISWVQEQTYYVDLENIISHLISIKVTGFTVEKPQLFYLKNKLTGLWLMRDEVDKVYPYDHTTYIGHRDKFAQQEIDSMQTGSYELVPVEDGE